MAVTLASLHIVLALLVSLSHISAQDQNQFIYNGFRGENLNLSGISKILPSGLLELTNTSKPKIGRAFFSFPFQFNASSSTSSQSLSFSTTFVFAMVPELPGIGGHGIAFAISPSTDFVGAVATQYLGLLNTTTDGLSSNHILAVELDTTESPDLQDINANHIGIDINSMNSIESAAVTYCDEDERQVKSLELIDGEPMQMWIDYDEGEMLLNVTVAPIRSRRPTKPLLSRNVNLSQVLLSSMYVGFSASTGSVASNQYILGWSFSKNGEAPSLDYSKLPSIPKSKKKPDTRFFIIISFISFAIVTALLLAVSGAAYLMRRKTYEEVREDWEEQYGPQRFSYKELYKATNGFEGKQLLGSGGFGKVFKGVLPSTKEQVPIKKVSHDSHQGMKEFIAEIASMGRLRHRNLVQLRGYCRGKGVLLLVYEYMPNGSLDKYLFSNEKQNLSWVQRFHILREVASGLLYLHEEWEQVVLHRDVKASNVLLDADLNGRLGDFGLAKLYDHGANAQTTRVVGTVGYLAPELTRTGKPSTNSDVFAFGSFMLEVACGRKPFDPGTTPEQMFLADWVFACWKGGDILRSTDSRLEGNYVMDEVELVLKLGLICIHSTPAARPSMRQVVQYLDKTPALPEITMQMVM